MLEAFLSLHHYYKPKPNIVIGVKGATHLVSVLLVDMPIYIDENQVSSAKVKSVLFRELVRLGYDFIFRWQACW